MGSPAQPRDTVIATRLYRRHAPIALCAALLLTLGACAEVELAAYTAKKIAPQTQADTGEYKVGKPYRVAGVWYYPAENPGFDQVGTASWYGADFHGKRTANGATFDMNALTAAHPTLPMPSQVRVTNLENGRALILTVNDRGPFARGRIIDVSRRAAQLLGFYRKGTARVRVQAVAVRGPAPKPADAVRVASAAPQAPSAPLSASPSAPASAVPRLAPSPVAPVSETLLLPPPGPGAVKSAAVAAPPGILGVGASNIDAIVGRVFYIQAGAFGDLGNAKRLSAALETFGRVRMMRVFVDGRPFYRVQVGPVASVDDADGLLARIVAAGYRNSHVIVE